MATNIVSNISFMVVFVSVIIWWIITQKIISCLQNKYPEKAKKLKLDKGNVLTISMWHPIRQFYIKLTLLGIMFRSSLMLDSKLRNYIWAIRLLMFIAIGGVVTLILTV